jgi:hypothetical protein
MSMLLLLIMLWDYSYDFTTDVIYDNNIFSYSPEYIADFMNQVDPYRFPFETYDDLISGPQLKLLIRNKFFGKRTTTFNLDFRLRHYLINQQKDYQKFVVGIRQSFGKYALKFSYDIIPNYLIRYYKNPRVSNNDYIGCVVKYQTLIGELSFTPRPNLGFDVQYKKRWEDYVKEFDTYDASGHHLALDVSIKVKKRTKFYFGYGFTISTPDSAVLQTDSEPMPDGAYHQHAITGGLVFGTKVIFPVELEFEYGYNFRDFTTDAYDDTMHFGRQDQTHRINAGTEFRILTGMLLGISYIRQWRKTTSDIFPDISGIKNYDKYKFSVGLSLYY